MTLGEKLAKLRKENNYTQEQLADLLGVSRQAVSKWESDLAYPETEKLLRLGELYHCSMDYLLKDEPPQPETPAKAAFDPRALYFERKSRRTVRGVPLWHINIGFGRKAKGIFAVGLTAVGVVSVGMLSVGVLSLGLLAVGLLAFGTLAIGALLAAGAISMGMIALGAIAIGVLAIGAMSVGLFSVGALAIGRWFAIGDHATAMIAIGKTEAVGSLYQASTITPSNRAEIGSLLDQTVPAIFAWLKNLIKLFI